MKCYQQEEALSSGSEMDHEREGLTGPILACKGSKWTGYTYGKGIEAVDHTGAPRGGGGERVADEVKEDIKVLKKNALEKAPEFKL